MRRAYGFSLIELMVVLAIIGVISAVAYPAYTDYVTSAKRADAKAALVGFANAMEQYRTLNHTYKKAALDDEDTGYPKPAVFPDKAPISGGAKTHSLKIKSAGDGTFVLQAIPVNTDPVCGTLELDQDGKGTPAGCW